MKQSSKLPPRTIRALEAAIQDYVSNYVERCFTTEELEDYLVAHHPQEWRLLCQCYPIHSGHYTARNWIAQRVIMLGRQGIVRIRQAPPDGCSHGLPCPSWPSFATARKADWGNSCVKHWIRLSSA